MKFFAIFMLILSFLASFFGPVDSPTGEVIVNPEPAPIEAGEICYPNDSNQICEEGYVCKANDYPIKYNCLLE